MLSPLIGALQGIRTPDLLVRSQTLYPTELAAQINFFTTEFRLPKYINISYRKNQPYFQKKSNLFLFLFLTERNYRSPDNAQHCR